MERDSRKEVAEEGFEWGSDTIEAEIRERVRGMIEAIIEEELESTLGAGRSQRIGAARTGYRHGARERQLTTSLGKTTIRLPRARLKGADGDESEWHSRIIRRYQRRTERVDSALLGTYLSGVNTRRLRGALAPLLRGAPLSKDAVSRLVGRLRDEFSAWSARDLAAEEVCYLFLDGWYPRVRIGKKRTRVPVLVTLGVCADGRRVVLDMRIAGQESEAAWRELLQSLVMRHLGTPALAVIDGNPACKRRCARNGLSSRFNDAPITSCATCWPRPRPTCARNWPRITGAWCMPTAARRSNMRAPASCASGDCAVRRWSARWKKPAMSCSPFCSSPNPSGKPSALPTRSSASTVNFADAPRPRPLCRVRMPCCCCYTDCYAAARSYCAESMGGIKCPNLKLTCKPLKRQLRDLSINRRTR